MRVRRWLRILLIVLAVLVAVAVIARLLVGSPWVEDRVARLIERQAAQALTAELAIGSLRGSLLGGDLVLRDVTLTDREGPVIEIAELRVRFQPWSVSSGDVQIDELVLAGLTVRMRQSAEGWNLARLVRPRAGPSGDPAIRSLSIARLGVTEAALWIEPVDAAIRQLEIRALDGALAFETGSLVIDVSRATVRDVASETAVELTARVARQDDRWTVDPFTASTADSRVSGRIMADGPLELVAEPLALRDLTPWLPDAARVPDAVATVSATGRPSDLAVEWSVRSQAGSASGTASGSWTDDTLRVASSFEGATVDLSRWLSDPRFDVPVSPVGHVTVVLPPDGTGALTMTFDATVPAAGFAGYRARSVTATGTWQDDRLRVTAEGEAYGAAVTADLHWRPGDGTLASSGRYRQLDVRRLPESLQPPVVATDLDGDYRLAGGPGGWTVTTTLTRAVVEGATIAPGATARFDSTSGRPAYAFDGAFSDLQLPRFAPPGPGPEALTRLEGRLNGSVTLEASGRTLDDLTLDATVSLQASELLDVRVDELAGTVSLRERRLAVDAGLTVRDLSARAVRPEAGDVFTASGRADVSLELEDVTTPVTWETVRGTARVALVDAVLRGVPFDQMDGDLTLEAGRLTVTTLSLRGRDGTASGSGALVLAGDGESSLDYAVRLADLSQMDPVAGRTLAGSVQLAGHLAGPADALTARGTLQAAAVSGGPVSMQSAEARYEVTMADLDVARITGSGTVHARLVDVSGRRIDDVQAEVAYAGERFDVDAELAEGARRVGLTGWYRPDGTHHEVSLRRLDVFADDIRWALPPGRDTVIGIWPDRVSLEGLALASGDARVTADGLLGIEEAVTGSRLTVTASQLPLEDVNRLLAGTRAVSGRVDATAVVSGSLRRPDARLEVRVESGEVEGVAFSALSASASFRDNRLDVDGELEAGPAGRFVVKGYLPLELVDSVDRPLPPSGYDLQIQSAGVNLALFQPMLPAVDDVRGLARVDLHVSGPADAPDVDGLATLEDGSFRMPATGVTYRRLNGHLTVQRQSLTVQELRFEDSDGHEGRVQGGLEIPVSSPPTGFDLRITSDGLHVLDNELGEIAVDAEMQMMGDLRTPLLVGTVTVTRGVIEASDLLTRLAAVEDPPGYVPPGMTAEDVARRQDSLDRMSVSITLALPDNVVVRGRDLRTGGGPIGLGDVNVTVGGALSIAKETGEETDLRGRLAVVRGQYQFQGRAFTIIRGSGVQFRGVPTNPALDFTAERVISGVTAQVRLRGTLEAPEIALSSRPPLDEGDILSLIVFGQAMNQLQSTDRVSLTARAGAIAASAIANPITDSVARALDLDEFQFRPGEGAAGSGTLTVGRQINDRLFIGFRYDFGASEASQVTFEYRLNQYLHVLTSLAQGGERSHGTQRTEAAGIDLIFRIRR